MPHKHNADRRHHIPKMLFKVQNWPAYGPPSTGPPPSTPAAVKSRATWIDADQAAAAVGLL